MLRIESLDDLWMPNTAGVVHLADWRMGPDGETYNAVWSPGWEMVSEGDLQTFTGSERLRLSSDARWVAIAYDPKDGKRVVGWLPGCQVKSWFPCNEPPVSRNCLWLTRERP